MAMIDRWAPTATAAAAKPSSTRCGLRVNRTRSFAERGSPSVPLATTTAPRRPWATASIFRPVGNPAPPRPAQSRGRNCGNQTAVDARHRTEPIEMISIRRAAVQWQQTANRFQAGIPGVTAGVAWARRHQKGTGHREPPERAGTRAGDRTGASGGDAYGRGDVGDVRAETGPIAAARAGPVRGGRRPVGRGERWPPTRHMTATATDNSERAKRPRAHGVPRSVPAAHPWTRARGQATYASQ